MYHIQNDGEIHNLNLIHAVNWFNEMDFSFQIHLCQVTSVRVTFNHGGKIWVGLDIDPATIVPTHVGIWLHPTIREE